MTTLFTFNEIDVLLTQERDFHLVVSDDEIDVADDAIAALKYIAAEFASSLEERLSASERTPSIQALIDAVRDNKLTIAIAE